MLTHDGWSVNRWLWTRDVPQAVLEAVVCGSRKDEVGSSELLQVPEPLELRRVDDPDEQRMQLHVAVDGIVKHLPNKAKPKSGSCSSKRREKHEQLHLNATGFTIQRCERDPGWSEPAPLKPVHDLALWSGDLTYQL